MWAGSQEDVNQSSQFSDEDDCNVCAVWLKNVNVEQIQINVFGLYTRRASGIRINELSLPSWRVCVTFSLFQQQLKWLAKCSFAAFFIQEYLKKKKTFSHN